MEYLKNNEIKNEVIDDLIDRLENYEDCESYGCDLAYYLYEDDNVNGCVFNYTQDNIDWIGKHFDDIGEVWEELKFQFGEDYIGKLNPFEEPWKVVLIIFMEVASYLLGQCKTVDKNWNNEMKLTKAKIKAIKEELEEMRDE